MLIGIGFAQVDASSALAAFNFGGVGGAVLGALVIQRLGSRITLMGMSAIAVRVSMVALARCGISSTFSSPIRPA